MIIKKWNDLIIEQISGINRNFAGIQFGKTNSGEGVNEGMLIYPADSFQGTNVKGVLGAKITYMLSLYLSPGCKMPTEGPGSIINLL